VSRIAASSPRPETATDWSRTDSRNVAGTFV
jgi:hypothetical protein